VLSPTIILIAIFLGTTALVGGAALAFRGGKSTGVEDRLDALTNTASSAVIEQENSLLAKSDTESSVETFVARFTDLRKLLEQAGMSIGPSKLLIVSAGLAIVGAVVCRVVGLHWVLMPVAAVTLGPLPFAWVLFKRKRRLGAFGAQLPDALELISRALRAGHSLAAGFNLVAQEMADPIGSEFGRVYESQNLGITLEESLEALTDRVPNLDLRFFATAVTLQRETGGDLAEILDKIGYLVRERFKIYGQVKALTGEGRLSGIVLLSLPPVLFCAMLRLNYDYCMSLFTDDLGKIMLAIAVALQVVGALVIRKIVNIKV